MKTNGLRTFISFLALIMSNVCAMYAGGHAEADNEPAVTTKAEDNVEISLLTCSPHDEVYSLYGHTAIRYRDKENDIDLAINYGVFSFHKPYFVVRFMFGLTDYEMGIEPFADFCREYEFYGSQVIQQTLNLTPVEKQSLIDALERNYQLVNRTYRYNYLRNNCTTKARDIIESCINGTVEYHGTYDKTATFRSLIHQCNESSRWARFGNDLLLGVKADRKLTRREQQFLPIRLQSDFDDALIKSPDGKRRRLVKETTIVVAGNVTVPETASCYPTPNVCAWIIFAAMVAVSVAEAIVRRKSILFDVVWLLMCGTAGLILLAMIFSAHPTVSLNLQIFILNPLALLGAIYILKNRHCKRNKLRFWLVVSVMLILAIVLSYIQQFAEGVLVLAFSLLIRAVWNITSVKLHDK